MKIQKSLAMIVAIMAILLPSLQGADHLVFEGEQGIGKGKHIVFIAGDEEYRSEEAMPLMAQIMAKQGFKCTVLFSIDDKGFVSPNSQSSLTNPSALDTADALVMSIRFRNWNDNAMQKFENIESQKFSHQSKCSKY